MRPVEDFWLGPVHSAKTKAAAHAAAFFMGIALAFVNARDACEKLK